MKATYVERYHDISCGHRVVGHESKCALLHGHNYRIHFRATAEKLDGIGRVIDFSALKFTLCQWLENNWDHKTLVWEDDHVINEVLGRVWKGPISDDRGNVTELGSVMSHSFVRVPFNPTAEHMGAYLLEVVGPMLLKGTGVRLVSVRVDETRKCSAIVEES